MVQNKGGDVVDNHIEKEYKFKDFKSALNFVNKIGEISEEENHHPNIYLEYGKVKIILWTHSQNKVTELDFKLAKKFDDIYGN